MPHSNLVAAVLAGIIATGPLELTGAAYAKTERSSATSDLANVDNVQMTIAQMIAIAEQHVGGRAIGTGSEHENGTALFYVEVLKAGQVRKVIVDLQSGRVVKTTMGETDNN